jgi:hypothetical protein
MSFVHSLAEAQSGLHSVPSELVKAARRPLCTPKLPVRRPSPHTPYASRSSARRESAERMGD